MINRDGKSTINNSIQELHNDSFDRDFNVNAVEILVFDSVTQTLRRVTSDAMNHYGTNNVDKNANGVVYEGLEDCDGNWQVVAISQSGNVTSNRYANIRNNTTYTNYTDAWDNRLTLTYELYGEAF